MGEKNDGGKWMARRGNVPGNEFEFRCRSWGRRCNILFEEKFYAHFLHPERNKKRVRFGPLNHKQFCAIPRLNNALAFKLRAIKQFLSIFSVPLWASTSVVTNSIGPRNYWENRNVNYECKICFLLLFHSFILWTAQFFFWRESYSDGINIQT